MPQEEEKTYTIRSLYRLYGLKLSSKELSQRAEAAARSMAEQALFEVHRKTKDRWEVAFPGDSVSQFRRVNS
jgi:hypothetical protein